MRFKFQHRIDWRIDYRCVSFIFRLNPRPTQSCQVSLHLSSRFLACFYVVSLCLSPFLSSFWLDLFSVVNFPFCCSDNRQEERFGDSDNEFILSDEDSNSYEDDERKSYWDDDDEDYNYDDDDEPRYKRQCTYWYTFYSLLVLEFLQSGLASVFSQCAFDRNYSGRKRKLSSDNYDFMPHYIK